MTAGQAVHLLLELRGMFMFIIADAVQVTGDRR